MTDRLDQFKQLGTKQWERLSSEASELRKFAASRRENDAPAYDEAKTKAAYLRGIDEDIKRSREATKLFLSPDRIAE